ncbi:MAG: hypothetical protein ACLQDV_06600 [Candidatus Binataceae bacterium]
MRTMADVNGTQQGIRRTVQIAFCAAVLLLIPPVSQAAGQQPGEIEQPKGTWQVPGEIKQP